MHGSGDGVIGVRFQRCQVFLAYVQPQRIFKLRVPQQSQLVSRKRGASDVPRRSNRCLPSRHLQSLPNGRQQSQMACSHRGIMLTGSKPPTALYLQQFTPITPSQLLGDAISSSYGKHCCPEAPVNTVVSKLIFFPFMSYF